MSWRLHWREIDLSGLHHWFGRLCLVQEHWYALDDLNPVRLDPARKGIDLDSTLMGLAQGIPESRIRLVVRTEPASITPLDDKHYR